MPSWRAGSSSGSPRISFAMHLRNRIAKLIRDLPEGDPARELGVWEIARLERLGFTGEVRGTEPQDGERPLRSVNDDAPTRRVPGQRHPLR